MNFVVKTWSNSGGARTGVLQLGNCPAPIETPALLISTRKGLPHFISPDHLLSLPSPHSHLIQFSPLHFCKISNYTTVGVRSGVEHVLVENGLEGLSPRTISKIGGLHRMLGLPEYGFAAVARDSIHCLPECNGTNKFGAAFETRCGRLLIKPLDFTEMICCMRPNIWTSLADEVSASVSDKRNTTSVDRTVRWLDECIALSSEKECGALFGSIVGGSNVEERKRCAEEVAKRNVSGYWIGGLGVGESMDEQPALLNAVTGTLHDDKPRLVSGLGLPEEVLQGVAAGIDLFDSEYLYHLTVQGLALTFMPGANEISGSGFHPNCVGTDQMKINLRATIFRKDTSPIVKNCKCYTCQNHTRAYINHLLNVREMLAQTLLEIHNIHQYLGFFSLIRYAINAGEFEQFGQKFIENRRDNLAEAAVC